jgi:hypothetical protein
MPDDGSGGCGGGGSGSGSGGGFYAHDCVDPATIPAGNVQMEDLEVCQTGRKLQS